MQLFKRVKKPCTIVNLPCTIPNKRTNVTYIGTGSNRIVGNFKPNTIRVLTKHKRAIITALTRSKRLAKKQGLHCIVNNY